ncbi:hypothetical protein Agub_g15800, partial [Astrephomene gubernaculifera]
HASSTRAKMPVHVAYQIKTVTSVVSPLRLLILQTLQEDIDISLWDMEPNEDSLVTLGVNAFPLVKQPLPPPLSPTHSRTPLPCMQASLRAAEPGGSGTKRSGADHRSPSRSPSSEASLRAAKPGGSGTEQRGADHRSPSRSPSPEASLRAAKPGGSEPNGAAPTTSPPAGAPALR